MLNDKYVIRLLYIIIITVHNIIASSISIKLCIGNNYVHIYYNCVAIDIIIQKKICIIIIKEM